MSMSSVIRYVSALDTAATDGSGKTGLVYSDITAKYVVEGGVLQSLTTETIATLGAYQAPTSAAHIRIRELAATDPTKGVYEVHFHDSQVASGGKKLWLFLSAAGARFELLEMDLSDIPNRLPAALVNGRMNADMQAAGAGVITASVIATDAIDADAIAPSAVSEIQSGLSTLNAAQVNAEVVDALATDTYAEPGQGAPAAAASLAAKIGYLYKAFRNKSTQTSTMYRLYADDGATIDQKATVSDDGTTFIREEVTTGP